MTIECLSLKGTAISLLPRLTEHHKRGDGKGQHLSSEQDMTLDSWPHSSYRCPHKTGSVIFQSWIRKGSLGGPSLGSYWQRGPPERVRHCFQWWSPWWIVHASLNNSIHAHSGGPIKLSGSQNQTKNRNQAKRHNSGKGAGEIRRIHGVECNQNVFNIQEFEWYSTNS